MSSSSYKRFAHLQISLEEIKSATNDFSGAHLIKRTAFGKAYRGQLLRFEQVIDIFAERLDRAQRQEDVEFWKEISMLSSLEHENLVSIVGYCDEQHEKIIITKLEANGSLDKFLGDRNLTWMRRLQISVGVAQALNYMYYDKHRDFSVIHRNINSSKIVLDDHWQPKLCGFAQSIYQTAARRDRLLITEFCGTPDYSDPTYWKTGTLTHKSDIYSFGVVLFEILCGKKASMVGEENMSLAPLARSHYERGTVNDMMDPGLWKQMEPESFKIFSEIAYYCLKEQPSQRPTTDQVVKKLKTALEYQQKHENPGEKLKHLRIPLRDIEKATKNFAEKYFIGSGTFGMVYRAKLYHFDDSKSLLPFEEKNKGELPKKRRTVAIKRILTRDDKKGEEGFLAEVEMLSRCKHPNILSLLGFCDEGRHMILVYEYASKGGLQDYLRSTGNMATLTWLERIKICIDVACGLNYIHTKIEDNQTIIHHDIKSGNILLGDNGEAKIGDFGLSRLLPENQVNSLYSKHITGTEVYWCPEYEKNGKLTNKIDIYSFGVVLFEMLSGRFANDSIYTNEDSYGIAPVARHRYNDGTIKEMVDPKLTEETHENIFSLNKGPDQDSLNAFIEIAYQCVAKTQAERPTAEVVIKKLEETLFFQEKAKDKLKIALADIQLATGNFSEDNLIGEGGSGKVYKGDVHTDRPNTIAAKRLDQRHMAGEHVFSCELQILMEYKHENIISLVGYCKEMDEEIIVLEYASRGSLDMHLKDNDLTWMKRLKICIDVASALTFIHGGTVTQDVVIHRDIKSATILLNDDWKAKISDFGISLISPINKDMDFVINAACGTVGYVDPQYIELGFLTEKSDIYSFGVVLIEVLCGRLAFDFTRNNNDNPRILPEMFKEYCQEGSLDVMVFKGIREQIVPKSLSSFQMIVHQCLHLERENRPTACEVLLQLKKALEFQMENTPANATGTTKNTVIPTTTDGFVPPVEQNSLVLPDSHAKKPEKFNGLNFKMWQQQMHSYLTTLDLATFLTEDAPMLNPEVADIQALNVINSWKHSDLLCRNHVLNSLADELSNMYSDAKTTKEIWESLDRKYNTENVDAKKSTVARFLEYKMDDSKRVVDQFQELQIILHGIHAQGMTLSESFQVAVIIEKLPPSWMDFKYYLQHNQKEMSLEDLLLRLQIEEDNKLKRKEL